MGHGLPLAPSLALRVSVGSGTSVGTAIPGQPHCCCDLTIQPARNRAGFRAGATKGPAGRNLPEAVPSNRARTAVGTAGNSPARSPGRRAPAARSGPASRWALAEPWAPIGSAAVVRRPAAAERRGVLAGTPVVRTACCSTVANSRSMTPWSVARTQWRPIS